MCSCEGIFRQSGSSGQTEASVLVNLQEFKDLHYFMQLLIFADNTPGYNSDFMEAVCYVLFKYI